MPERRHDDAVQWRSQLETLAALAEEVKKTTSSALALFVTRDDSDDWLVIDRALLIATSVRDSMHHTYSKLRDARKRHLIAVALFELGDMSVTPDLIEAVENDEDIFMLAANKLSNKSVTEAVPAILRRLELSVGADAVVIATLLRALSRLSDDLPQKTYDCFINRNSPEIQDALTAFRRKR